MLYDALCLVKGFAECVTWCILITFPVAVVGGPGKKSRSGRGGARSLVQIMRSEAARLLALWARRPPLPHQPPSPGKRDAFARPPTEASFMAATKKAVLGPLVGAVDQGTSSTRFLVFNSKTAELLSHHQVEIKQEFPREGYVS